MRIALAVAIALGVGSIVAADPSHAAIRKSTSIPAQSLGPALKEFAESRDLQLLYFTDTVRHLRTAGAVGEITADEALTQILDGTGLTYRYLNDETVTILPIAEAMKPQTSTPDPAAAAEKAGTLPDRARKSASFWGRFRLAQADVQRSVATAEGAAATGEPEELGLEEIIVTAQKREERLQDVPVSISVLSGEVLDHTVQTVSEMLGRTPGVATLETGFGMTTLTVRGATGPGVNQGSSTVGYYLDSAPFAQIRNSPVPDSNAYDLDRVEVLRGPQGTLYGASSANGVVRVLTKDADVNKFELKARAAGSGTVDGGENFRGDMALNVPVIEGKLAVRAVAGYEDWSGWIDRPIGKDANDTETRNVRLKVKAQPTDALSIGLSAWRSRSDFNGRAAATDERTYPSLINEPQAADYDVYGLTVDYDFPAMSFTSATSYLDFTNAATLDYEAIFGRGAPGAACCANTILLTTFDSEVFAQEFNLSSTGTGPWRWTAGAMYRDVKDKFFQWRRQYANPSGNRFYDTSESIAVFGQLTRLLMGERLEITGGLRYFEDKVVTQETSRTTGPVAALLSADDTFDAVSPRAVLTWHWSDALMSYASYSEGFRSGFSQQPIVLINAPSLPPIDPDNLRNYEIGAKGSIWNKRLNFDMAVFYIDWQDIQQNIGIIANSGTGTPISVTAGVNGESASGIGAEFGLSFSPVEDLVLGANFGWNDLTMDARVFSGTTMIFEKGDRLNNSPEYSAGVSADYAFPLGAGDYEAVLSTSANYSSQRHLRKVVNGNNVVLKGDNLLTARASLGVNSPNNWSASLFVENLTDEDGSSVAPIEVNEKIRLRPRTIGLQLEYKY